jgi:putative ABC transport system permease protein
MTRHLLRLMWNRRGSNALVAVEIFVSFLVIFVVAGLAIWMADNYRQPLGFGYRDVWVVEMSATRSETGWTAADRASMRQVLEAARTAPEVLAAAAGGPLPWSHSHHMDGATTGNRQLRWGVAEVSDGFADVMGLELVSGRWFSGEDDGAAWDPVVINTRLAHDAFGDLDPLGRDPRGPASRREATQRPQRVVGVIRDFRQDGEYGVAGNFLFQRDVGDVHSMPLLVVRVRPGTGAAFEETLSKRLASVGPQWTLRVRPLAELRESYNQLSLAPVAAVAVVAAFLMMMVGLGLSGVLWQSVTQRTRELGLRRAKGATAGAIQRQILAEILIVTSVAAALGTLVIVQFPLLAVITGVGPAVYASSLAIALGGIYVLALACGLYPSRLATRMSPAEALRYE